MGVIMQEIKALLRRYKIWNHHLEKVANEIGEGNLEYSPMPESNSAAWILVHLIQHYREFLELIEDADELLAALPVADDDMLAGTPFAQIFALLQEYRQAFFAEIKRLGDNELLDSEVPAGEDKTWRDLIYSVVSHEIYHCGQLAYIAKILQQKAKSTD